MRDEKKQDENILMPSVRDALEDLFERILLGCTAVTSAKRKTLRRGRPCAVPELDALHDLVDSSRLVTLATLIVEGRRGELKRIAREGSYFDREALRILGENDPSFVLRVQSEAPRHDEICAHCRLRKELRELEIATILETCSKLRLA